jgi:hypothetical protein
MSRIIKILCRIMAVLTSLWVLKPAVDVYADTGKTYHSKAEPSKYEAEYFPR